MKCFRPVITGFHSEQTPTNWEKYLRPGSAPDPKVVLEVKRLEGFLKGVVQKAWDSAKLDSSLAAHCGAVFGSFYASNSMSEYINATLLSGARWLNPEAFLYYSPHTCAGNVVQHLRLEGDAITLLGPDASYESLVHSMRLISLGRHPVILCTEFEWATPFSKWMAERLDITLDPNLGKAATLVIEDRAHALARGASIWAELETEVGAENFPIPLHTELLAEIAENFQNVDLGSLSFRRGAIGFKKAMR